MSIVPRGAVATILNTAKLRTLVAILINSALLASRAKSRAIVPTAACTVAFGIHAMHRNSFSFVSNELNVTEK